MWGTTSSTNGSNIRGEPGRARRTALSHLRALERRWRTRRGSLSAKSKQAMKQVLGIKDEAARMKVTPPLAVAPLAHGDDMRWNPNDDGINVNP